MSNAPPAFCPTHGLFPAHGLVGAVNLPHGVDIQISQVSVSCPLCGASSPVLPGTYNFLPDSFKLIVDPRLTKNQLVVVKSIAERVQRREISVSQAYEEAEKVAPGTGRFFNVREWSDQAKATLYAGILTTVTAIAIATMASRGGGDVTNNYYYNSPPQTEVTEPAGSRVNRQGKIKGQRKFDMLKAGKIPLPKRKPKKRP